MGKIINGQLGKIINDEPRNQVIAGRSIHQKHRWEIKVLTQISLCKSQPLLATADVDQLSSLRGKQDELFEVMHLVLLEKSEIGIETSLKRNVQALQKDLEEKDEQYRNVVNQLQEIRSAELEQKLTDALRNAGTMEDQVKQLRFELTLFQDHLHSNQSQPTIVPLNSQVELDEHAQRSASISLNGSSNERIVESHEKNFRYRRLEKSSRSLPYPPLHTYRNAKGSGQQREQTDMSIDDEEVEAEDTVASRVVLS
ncbi:MAG: hypothetical protein NXY57DRAFT_1044723 [Lentinula lateritia]|nr:MAG: hypothetical protein NXY57DRAFT_1044723 [Lentinula lateritia]